MRVSKQWSLVLLFDMDNDGYKDIYVCNGIYHHDLNQDFVDFFANEFMQMVVSGKKEQIETIINRMQVSPILCFLKTIKLNFY
jgi:hypothetical protein